MDVGHDRMSRSVDPLPADYEGGGGHLAKSYQRDARTTVDGQHAGEAKTVGWTSRFGRRQIRCITILGLAHFSLTVAEPKNIQPE